MFATAEILGPVGADVIRGGVATLGVRRTDRLATAFVRTPSPRVSQTAIAFAEAVRAPGAITTEMLGQADADFIPGNIATIGVLIADQMATAFVITPDRRVQLTAIALPRAGPAIILPISAEAVRFGHA